MRNPLSLFRLVRGELRSACHALESCQSQLQECRAENHHLAQQVEDVTASRDDLLSKLTAATSSRDELHTENHHLAQQVEALKLSLAEHRKLRDQAIATARSRQEQRDRANATVTRLQSDLSGAKAALAATNTIHARRIQDELDAVSTDKPIGKRQEIEVVRVIDGDSLAVRTPQQGQHRPPLEVRLLEIDAPELTQDFGPEAHEQLQWLVNRHRTDGPLYLDVFGIDLYGRIVGNILVQDLDGLYASPDLFNLSSMMVIGGYAARDNRFSTVLSNLSELETRARETGDGIWQTPGLHQTPWLARQGGR